MQAGKRSINDIFNGNRILEIPFFQRAYVWEENQWERLLHDMEMVSSLKKPYFLGSVILKQQDTDSSYDVGDLRTLIDGQQRLTTLNIFFKVLCLKTNNNRFFNRVFRLVNDNEDIALFHNHNDVDAFNEVLNLNEEKIFENKEKDKIHMCYEYFRKNVNPEKLDVRTISSNLTFVGIDLNKDEDEQQIFDTINSLGVRLTVAELLKNYFYGRNDIKAYEKQWKSIFESDPDTIDFWESDNEFGRSKRQNIEMFFYAFLQIKIFSHNVKVNTEDRLEFGKFDGLFESYKKFINDYNVDKKELLNDIMDYADVFKANINPEDVMNEIPNNPSIQRINTIIFGLENTTLIPYVLFVLKNVTDKFEQQKIFEFLEGYVMRRMVCKTTTKDYNRLFTDRFIGNNLLTAVALKDYLVSKSEKVNFIPSDADLLKGFHESKITNKQTRGILYLIESKIRNRKSQSTALLGLNDYSLEHLMPKKWENNWGILDTEEEIKERDKKILTLGNLAIITSSLNSSIRDAAWKVKKEGKRDRGGLKRYASGLETMGDILDLEIWNEKGIEERAVFLYNHASKIWHVR